jgi:hypothetical protein
MENMENFEIYYDLINGKLDDTTAKKLFSSLATDDEQRLDFNSYRSVSETIKNNLNTFQPGAELKNRIYAKAGVNMMLLDNQVPTHLSSNPEFFGSKIFTGISSGILSGVVVYLLMQFVGFPSYLKNYSNSFAEKSFAKNKTIPVSESREIASDNKIIQKPIIKYIYVYRDNEKILESNNLDFNKTQNPSIKDVIEIAKIKEFSHPKNSQFIENSNIKSLNQNDIFDLSKTPDNLGLSFEFGSSQNWNIPRETLYPTEINQFNTLAFTVFYDINDFIKVGANIKQETFFMQYSGTEDIGSIFNYRQHSNLTTYSAVIRAFTGGYDIFKPYFQASVGANESGIVLRPQIGFEFQPNDNVSVNFGFDYSYFRFIHQNSWFTSDKVGINYGISYKF